MRAAAEIAAAATRVAATLTAVGVIVARVGVAQRWAAARAEAWADATVGEVVDRRLHARNGGSSIMDAVDRIELEIRGLHGSHADIADRVDRLGSDLAMLRVIADERAGHSEQRDHALEARLDRLAEALLRR